jgi:3-phosphoshikimate 1-carboxyvinyltransferase
MSPANKILTVMPGGPLRGECCLPGDKSLSHRVALLAALAQGQSRIDHFLVAGVTQVMLKALRDLGVAWRLDADRLFVDGKGLQELKPPLQPLNCGNSATTLRLLAGALAATGTPAVLDGRPGLQRRPMNRIVKPLQQMGVKISSEGGFAPLALATSKRPLQPLDYTLPVASAQVKSCLLLAALAARGTSILREPNPSRDHTERMLRSMGVVVECEQLFDDGGHQYVTRLTPPKPLRLMPLDFAIPGDISSAAFLIVASLITPGSEVLIRNVGLNPTRTGLLDVLADMGAEIVIEPHGDQQGEPVGDLCVRSSVLHGTQVTGPLVVRMIDEFPAFAIAAAFAQGLTKVSQAEELRLKESDRISMLCHELASLGVQVSETPDGFTIQGGELPQGGQVNAHSDHRLAMSLALVGLASQECVTVSGAEMITESFPGFIEVLRGLGARMESQE